MKNIPDNYEWWVDCIQDCLCQISGDHEKINKDGNACMHICDETYLDLDHFVKCIISNGYNDMPRDVWNGIMYLNSGIDLRDVHAGTAARKLNRHNYFSSRARWKYNC